MTTRYASATAWHQAVGLRYDDCTTGQGLDTDVPLAQAVREWLRVGAPDEFTGHVQVLFLVAPDQPQISPYVRPKYALDGEGRVRLIGTTADEVSITSVWAASALGYNGWHTDRCLVVHEEAPGYGGNGFVVTDFELFFQLLAPSLLEALVAYTSRGVGDVWNGITFRRERRLAWFWKESQGIANAQELREFIDTMPDRTPSHVARRLALPKSAAKELLRCLGYAKDSYSGLWELSHHPKLAKRRRRWKKNELQWFPPPETS